MSWEFAKDENKETKISKAESFEIECAGRLYNALAKKRKSNGYSQAHWSKEFSKMIKFDKRTKEEITQALEWYCKHIGEEYVPEAHSAKSFRSKFLSIQKQSNKSIDKKVDLSDKAKILYKEFRDKKWPAILRMQLPNIIQTSIDNYRYYWRQAKSLRDQWVAKGKESKKPKSLAKDLLLLESIIRSGHLCSPLQFIRSWLHQIQETYEKFDQWDGDPNNIMFSTGNQKIVRWMCLWAYNWCGDGEKGLLLHQKIVGTTVED